MGSEMCIRDRVGGSAATGKRPEGAALDAGASGAYIASPPSRKTSSGQMQARAAAPERARPRPFPGHGKPSTAGAPRSTEPGQRPMPASREERRPPRQRRDRAADRQDAGTRLWRTSSARAQPWHIPRRRPAAGAPRFWGRTATGAGGAGGGGGGRPRGHGRTWGWQARQPPTRRLRRQGCDRERRGAGRGSEHAGRVAGSRECEDPPANGRLPARQRPGGRQPQRSAGARQGPPRARGRRGTRLQRGAVCGAWRPPGAPTAAVRAGVRAWRRSPAPHGLLEAPRGQKRGVLTRQRTGTAGAGKGLAWGDKEEENARREIRKASRSVTPARLVDTIPQHEELPCLHPAYQHLTTKTSLSYSLTPISTTTP